MHQCCKWPKNEIHIGYPYKKQREHGTRGKNRNKNVGKPYNAADARVGVVSPRFGGGVVVGVRDGSGLMSSPVVTSYSPHHHSNHHGQLWLLLGHVYLSPFSLCSDLSRTDRQTDERNWSSKRRHYALKCIGRQESNSTSPMTSSDI